MKKSKKTNESRKKRLFQGKELEKRIKTGQQKSKGYRSNVFKPGIEFEQYTPKDGSHIIDIIPYLAGKNDPATEEGNPTYTFEYLVHRVGPNNTEYICPSMYGKKCPVCEHRNKLREKDDDNYKDYWPKTRNLYNVISYDDKKERKKGIQVWDVSNFYFERPLMAISRKPSRSGNEEKTINFVDPVNGKSISFTIEKAKSKDDFPKFVGHAFDDRDYEIDDDILDKAIALDELVHLAPYKEIKEAMFAQEEEEEEEEVANDDNETSNELLLDELEECEDMEELIEFAEEHDLEVDEDGKFKKEKKKLKEQLLEEKPKKSKKKKSKSEDEEEDDEEDDSDDEEDDDDSDDDEEEEEEEENLPTKKEIKKMKYKELKALIKEHDLDIDVDDYSKDDIDDMRKEIIEELDI